MFDVLTNGARCPSPLSTLPSPPESRSATKRAEAVCNPIADVFGVRSCQKRFRRIPVSRNRIYILAAEKLCADSPLQPSTHLTVESIGVLCASLRAVARAIALCSTHVRIDFAISFACSEHGTKCAALDTLGRRKQTKPNKSRPNKISITFRLSAAQIDSVCFRLIAMFAFAPRNRVHICAERCWPFIGHRLRCLQITM